VSGSVDVLIAGGGPVGTVLAGSLAGSGLDVLVVDAGRPQGETLRPIALSHGSRLLLERLDAFAGLAQTPIHAIHVSQRGGFGRTLLTCEEFDLPALGYVANLPELAAHLGTRIAPPTLRARVVGWEGGEAAARVRVERDGAQEEWRARLVVIADGGGGARAGLAQRDYHQVAIVAAVAVEAESAGVAWERFIPGGPLALLPFRERYALVWTVPSAAAPRLLESPAADFLARLGAAFGGRLGRFVSVEGRAAYPLQLRFQRETAAAPRVLVVGNAAQTLHPVAGQGLNLGLRDAGELAELVRATPATELGAASFLARAARARALDRNATIGLTDLLVRAFSNTNPAVALARGLGLAALDVLPPARRFLARRMIFGSRALP